MGSSSEYNFPYNLTTLSRGNETQDGDSDLLGSAGAVIIGTLVGGVVLLLHVVVFYFYSRREPEPQEAEEPPTISKKEKRSLRYNEIESWLVTKIAEPHDRLCEAVVHGRCTKGFRGRTCSIETVDCESDFSEGIECPICMDVIAGGDYVSWSANPKCNHVYHHLCIKNWLLKREDCPFCRECFLPIDSIPKTSNMKHISELILAQQQRSAHCFFCVQDGIVVVPNTLALADESDRQKIVERERRTPKRSDLLALRKRPMMEDGGVKEWTVPSGSDDFLPTEFSSSGELLSPSEESLSSEDPPVSESDEENQTTPSREE